jgi:hypothetical protein
MSISAPALVFVILVPFVLGVAAGIQFWRFTLIYGVRYAPCKLFHKLISKSLTEHWKHNPDCNIEDDLIGERQLPVDRPLTQIGLLEGTSKMLFPPANAPECLREAFTAGVTSDYLDTSIPQDHWINACMSYRQ